MGYAHPLFRRKGGIRHTDISSALPVLIPNHSTTISERHGHGRCTYVQRKHGHRVLRTFGHAFGRNRQRRGQARLLHKTPCLVVLQTTRGVTTICYHLCLPHSPTPISPSFVRNGAHSLLATLRPSKSHPPRHRTVKQNKSNTSTGTPPTSFRQPGGIRPPHTNHNPFAGSLPNRGPTILTIKDRQRWSLSRTHVLQHTVADPNGTHVCVMQRLL